MEPVFDRGDIVFFECDGGDKGLFGEYSVQQLDGTGHGPGDTAYLARIGESCIFGAASVKLLRLVKPARWRVGDRVRWPNGMESTIDEHSILLTFSTHESIGFSLVHRPGVTLYNAPSSSPAGPCDECKGRGTVKLFLTVQPCSRGCRG